jgi:hypothetical protein
LVEGLPGEIGIGDAAYGTLGDAGIGGVEAVECGFPAEVSPLITTDGEAIADQSAHARDPDSLEGVDEDAGPVTEDAVIEGDGFGSNLMGACRPILDKLHADRAQALFGKML